MSAVPRFGAGIIRHSCELGVNIKDLAFPHQQKLDMDCTKRYDIALDRLVFLHQGQFLQIISRLDSPPPKVIMINLHKQVYWHIIVSFMTYGVYLLLYCHVVNRMKRCRKGP